MNNDVLRIIERIYEAAAEPSAFRVLSAELAREFGAESTLLFTVENSRTRGRAVNKDLLSATANFDDWAHRSYTNYYLQRDEWMRHLIRTPAANVVTDQDLMRVSDFENSEIYNDYYRGIGIFHGLGGVFPIRGNDFGVVAIHRPRTGEEFGRQERKLMLQLVPHLQRVFQIHQRLDAVEKGRALTTEVLERLSLGAIIVDGNARVMFVNDLAQRHLQAGMGITVLRGCVRARQADQQAVLEKIIGEAALTGIGRATSSGGFVVVSRPTQAPLSLLISPFRATAGELPEQRAALILISDPDARTPVPEHVLAKAFKLSTAEARLLSALVAGTTMADYAAAAHVTMNTAKTQMRQIFLKTGCNRQADVIRAVLSDPLIKIHSASKDAAHTA